MDQNFEEDHEWGSDVIISAVVAIVVFIVLTLVILISIAAI